MLSGRFDKMRLDLSAIAVAVLEEFDDKKTTPPPQIAYRVAMAMKERTENRGNIDSRYFAEQYPGYVDKITAKISEAWQDWAADPRTFGTEVGVTFAIERDGTIANSHISQPSESQKLNDLAIRAVQRVHSLGPLPSEYKSSSVTFEYIFTYGVRPPRLYRQGASDDAR